MAGMSMYYYIANTDRYGLKRGEKILIFANNQYATDILCIKSIVTGSCVLAVSSALA